MNWHLEKIEAIEEDLRVYYETDFESGEKDYEVNFKIKGSLAKILRDAINELDGTDLEVVKEKVLLIFSDNTGCAEDAEIFEEVSKGLINEDEKLKVLSRSASNRWG